MVLCPSYCTRAIGGESFAPFSTASRYTRVRASISRSSNAVSDGVKDDDMVSAEIGPRPQSLSMASDADCRCSNLAGTWKAHSERKRHK